MTSSIPGWSAGTFSPQTVGATATQNLFRIPDREIEPGPPKGSVQNLSHIWSGDGFGLRDLRLIERPHVHVALG